MQQRRSPRWARTHRSILVAAEELFDRQGIDSTSVVDIASRADVAVGSLYSHFESKEALAMALVEQAFEAADERFVAARSMDAPLERAFAVGRTYVWLAQEHPVAGRSLLMRGVDPRASTDPATIRRRIDARMAELWAGVEQDLQEAIDAGAIIGTTAPQARTLLTATWNGIATMLVQRDGAHITPDLATNVLDLAESAFSAGLRVPQ